MGTTTLRDDVVRQQLEGLVRGEGAHVSVGGALEGLPEALRGRVPDGLAHSAWQLLEHLRIAQEDLLQYALDPEWTSPSWPDGYWPADPQPASDAAWQDSVRAFERDRELALSLVRDAERDLTAPLTHTPGHTLLRQLLLLADHNAYHGAQLVDVRRALGAWPSA
jgi:hypothetical protein